MNNTGNEDNTQFEFLWCISTKHVICEANIKCIIFQVKSKFICTTLFCHDFRLKKIITWKALHLYGRITIVMLMASSLCMIDR